MNLPAGFFFYFSQKGVFGSALRLIIPPPPPSQLANLAIAANPYIRTMTPGPLPPCLQGEADHWVRARLPEQRVRGAGGRHCAGAGGHMCGGLSLGCGPAVRM